METKGQPSSGSGDLVVSVAIRRYAGMTVGIWAAVKDAAGHSIEATCSGTAGRRELPARWARSHGTPAVWIVRVRAGIRIAIAAETADGRGGWGAAAVPLRPPRLCERRRCDDRL